MQIESNGMVLMSSGMKDPHRDVWSSRYRRLHSSSARRLRSGELTAVAADLSPNAQKSLPSQFRRRTQLRRRHLAIAAELVAADFAEVEFAAITGKNSSPPQQRAIAVEAESYLPSPSQQGAVLPSRRHHHRSRLFRLPLPLQQQRAPVFLRGKLEGELKKERHRISGDRGKAFLADLKCFETEMEVGSILAQNDAMRAEVENAGS
nr:hypothetical protein Iba_chr11eCG9370 [Ipomoea batatas]